LELPHDASSPEPSKDGNVPKVGRCANGAAAVVEGHETNGPWSRLKAMATLLLEAGQ